MANHMSLSLIQSPLLAFLFLCGASLLTGASTALQRIGRFHAQEEFKNITGLRFFQFFLKWSFKEKKWQGIFFTLNFTRLLLQLVYGICAFFFLLSTDPFSHALEAHDHGFQWNILWILTILAITIAASLLIDFLMSLLALIKPRIFLRVLSPIISFLLFICSPFTLLFLKSLKIFIPSHKKEATPSFSMREKILEVLHESELSPYLDPNDQKLILSVVSFKERIAREIMVPRIKVFSLSADTTLQDAVKEFLDEGYSRIPVFRDNVDHVIGVLHFKDVLSMYAKATKNKEEAKYFKLPIENLVKPVLYTPETKKISVLLQEFRSKQIHLAIVVDEYGGTEGILTIEDILEELVGEIADEYDIEEEVLFSPLPSGGWIVDARMSILDIAEKLNLRIPQSPEYDTIGGYVFHRAGSIPSKGWRIHHDDFDLEVLSSNERSIEKIRITPIETEP